MFPGKLFVTGDVLMNFSPVELFFFAHPGIFDRYSVMSLPDFNLFFIKLCAKPIFLHNCLIY